jgi:Sulfotransferase family
LGTLLSSEPLAAVEGPNSVISSNDCPIFIVGTSRSGTTLLSRMLDTHSEIAILPETWWYVVLDRLGCLEEFTNPWQTALFYHEVWENLKSCKDPAARVMAREASRDPKYVGPTARLIERIGKAYAQERQAKIWGEKTPGHALWLPQIRNLFPRARVLFIVRDPRDVLVSYDDRWNHGRRDSDYVISSAALLKYFLGYLLRSPGFAPEQIRLVKYESLVAGPSEVLEQVCQFLGVEFQPSMLGYYRRYANVESEMAEGRHHALLSKPVTAQKIGRYQEALSPSQIALVERFLADEMRDLEYPLSQNGEVSFAAEEERAFRKAQSDYQQMISGEIRRRFRRKGKRKLRAYQIFGRALDLIPSWRVSNTAIAWNSLADRAAGDREG